MNTDLPVQGHRLGWIRVATSLAVRGVPPDRDAISTWMRDEGAHGESLSTSARGAPARMAVALGFLDDGLNPTDRGRALDLAAERYAPAASLFSHHIAIRWLLWHATATTEPAWWRAVWAAQTLELRT